MTRSICRLDDFKDNCGFGLIAHSKGNASHKLLQNAIEALTCMTHRGGVAADGKTGDGCGLLMQKPDGFLRTVVKQPSTLSCPIPMRSVQLCLALTKSEKRKVNSKRRAEGQGLSVIGGARCRQIIAVLAPLAESLPAFEQIFIDKVLKTKKHLRTKKHLQRVYIWVDARQKTAMTTKISI